MGNSCCEGRANKPSPAPLVRKPTLISSKLKRERGNSFKRSVSSVARNQPHLMRTTTTVSGARHNKKKETLSHQETELSVDHPSLESKPTEPIFIPALTLPDPQSDLQPLPEEDPIEDSLGLTYTLEGGRDCSHDQQKQLLALFDSDEELDSLATVSLHHSKDKFDVLVLILTSKCVYLLETTDYSDVKCRIYLSCLRLLCVNSDRSAVVVVYQRGLEGLEHVILSSTRLEALLKAMVSVHFEEEGKLLPALSQPTMTDALEFVSSLTTTALAEMNTKEALKVQKLFATQGLIGENKLLMIQCLKEIQGKERAVQLLVSDRAFYTLSYTFFLLDRIALDQVKAVRFEDACNVCIEAEGEHRFNLPNQQGQELQHTLSAYLRRAVTV